jgi:hypothetical protein
MKWCSNGGKEIILRDLALTVLVVGLIAGCAKTKHAEQVSLEDLNRVLAVTSMSTGKLPQSVYELTNFPSLRGKELPVPPAGKKLVIDRNARQVVFADQ